MSERKIFPKWVNDYLKENEVKITQIPESYRVSEEKALADIPIKTARQLHEYIVSEEAFWTADVTKNNYIVKEKWKNIASAKSSFEKALEIENEANRQAALKRAIDYICAWEFGSKTKLAKIFVRYSNENQSFFQGFEGAVTGKQFPVQNQSLVGFIVGLEYKKIIANLYTGMVGEEMTNFNIAADEATKKVNEIMSRAESHYDDHKQKHDELHNVHIQNHIDLIEDIKREQEASKKDFADFMASSQAERLALESAYNEHLKLSEPAKHWTDMERSYKKSGWFWLITTSIVTVAAIVVLTIIILGVDPFDLGEWAEGIRTTAFITMLVTIFMFVVRFTIKMATSSFHLARDAKEREQLTCFYLALIRKGAVQESERHLIITSLLAELKQACLRVILHQKCHRVLI